MTRLFLPTRLFPGIIALSILAHPAASVAQMPTPSLPTILHLKDVPVGSFATYRVNMPDQAPMRQKVSVVGRSDKGASIEIQVGDEGAASKRTILVRIDLVFKNDATWTPSTMAIQVGENKAMALPAQLPSYGSLFQLIDRNTLGKPETLKVAAGTFKTRRFEPKGATKIAWMSENVPPFGLVKMSEGRAGATVDMELVERGAGAKPVLVGASLPFNPGELMQQMAAMQGHAAGAPRPLKPKPTPKPKP
ncbi:MAG: hypothetical protein SGI86_08295 [Deltaproteobacteria bacterium]|nr:hypothetical protein [Deltaproteobacteria bacterium]